MWALKNLVLSVSQGFRRPRRLARQVGEDGEVVPRMRLDGVAVPADRHHAAQRPLGAGAEPLRQGVGQVDGEVVGPFGGPVGEGGAVGGAGAGGDRGDHGL